MLTGIEDFVCPVCGSCEFGQSEKYRAKHEMFDGVFIVECTLCHAWSAYPQVEQDALSVLYDEGNVYWTEAVYKERLDSLEAQMVSRCEFIKSVYSPQKNIRVLDVGASLGVFNRVVKRCFGNIEVEYNAVEVNPASLAFLRENCDNDKIYSSIHEVEGRFDVIILSHILEHIMSPVNFLKDIRRRLNVNGVAFIEVPNEDFRFKKYHQPHVLFYNIESLNFILKKSGLFSAKKSTCGRKIKSIKVENGTDRYTFIEKMLVFLSGLILFRRRKGAKPESRYVEYESYGGDRRWIRLVARNNIR